MKRAGIAAGFFLLGLLTTWASMWVGSHMSYRFYSWHLPHRAGGCYEIDQCAFPWWLAVAFMAFLLGPSLVFALVGWLGGRPGNSVIRTGYRLIVMVILTALLYLAAYATGP